MFESTRKSFYGLGAMLGIIIPPPPDIPKGAPKELHAKREDCMDLLKKAYEEYYSKKHTTEAYGQYEKCVRELQALGLKHNFWLEAPHWTITQFAMVTSEGKAVVVPKRPAWPGYPPGFVGPPQDFSEGKGPTSPPPAPPPTPVETPKTRFRPSQIPQGAMVPQRYDWTARAVPISPAAAAQATAYRSPQVPFGFGPMFASGPTAYGGPLA